MIVLDGKRMGGREELHAELDRQLKVQETAKEKSGVS